MPKRTTPAGRSVARVTGRLCCWLGLLVVATLVSVAIRWLLPAFDASNTVLRPLGAALLARFVDLGWAKRARDSRVVLLTANGERALHKMFDAHGAA